MTSTRPTPASTAEAPAAPPAGDAADGCRGAAHQRADERADSEIVGLRVGVKNGGCAGQSYTVEYAHDVRPTDEVVEDKGVKILVDPKAVLFLLGTEMDYKADKMQAQFVFNNPNQISACGCGESVELRPRRSTGKPLSSHSTRAKPCRISAMLSDQIPVYLAVVFR